MLQGRHRGPVRRHRRRRRQSIGRVARRKATYADGHRRGQPLAEPHHRLTTGAQFAFGVRRWLLSNHLRTAVDEGPAAGRPLPEEREQARDLELAARGEGVLVGALGGQQREVAVVGQQLVVEGQGPPRADGVAPPLGRLPDAPRRRPVRTLVVARSTASCASATSRMLSWGTRRPGPRRPRSRRPAPPWRRGGRGGCPPRERRRRAS